MLIGLLEEVYSGLKELAPDSPTWAKMLGRCDLALLRQQAEHGAVGIEDLLHALSIATEALAVGGSVEAEDEARAWSSAVLEAVGEAAAQDGLNGLAATLPPVFEGFWERLEALREAAVAFRLAPALDALAQHGTEYERAAFERDFPPGSALPKTEEWLAGIPAPANDLTKTVDKVHDLLYWFLTRGHHPTGPSLRQDRGAGGVLPRRALRAVDRLLYHFDTRQVAHIHTAHAVLL